MSRLGFFAALLICFAATASANQATEQCGTVYRDNLAKVNNTSMTAFAIKTVAKNECRSDGTAINASYSNQSAPLMGAITSLGGSYSNTSEFCSAYHRGIFSSITSATYDRVPLVEMATQFNSCMKIATQHNFAVWSQTNGPGEVVYSGRYFSGGNSEFWFETTANAQGMECFEPGRLGESKVPNGRKIKVKNVFNLSCRRQSRADGSDTIFDAAYVIVSMDGEPYPFTLKADRIFGEPVVGIASAQEAAEKIAELERKLSQASSLSDDLKARRYFARIAYTGDSQKAISRQRIIEPGTVSDGIEAIRFGCDFRGRLKPESNNEHRRQLGLKMGEKVCGKPENVANWRYIGHHNGNEASEGLLGIAYSCQADYYLFTCFQ